MSAQDFIRIDSPQVHFRRRKEILRDHPEVRDLIGPNRWTPLIILGLVLGQLALAYAFRDLSLWAVIALAWLVGGAFSHALFVMIHEATHNLVAKSVTANRLWAITCDFALGFPGAMSFRKYHLLHHRHMGEEALDADLASAAEARLIGNVWWRKAIWMFFFSISQGLRPSKIEGVQLMDRWSVLGAAAVLAFDVALILVAGPYALAYLLLSMLFGLGLHPLGGRWIQEHYVTEPGQETYSYYGPANAIAFNVGYHNEHHDFMNVAWNRLPALNRLAPEMYEPLKSYRSWTALLIRFIFDPTLSPFSRIVHPGKTRKAPDLAR